MMTKRHSKESKSYWILNRTFRFSEL